MKIRIKGNSIRIRLTQSETARFGTDGVIEDHTEFGASAAERLSCVLVAETNAEQISARFENGRISVVVPREIADEWSKSGQVGIGGEQIISPEKTLRITIEKDFTCLVPRKTEDETDNFPHPKNK